MVMHVSAAKTPKEIGLTLGIKASSTAIADHVALPGRDSLRNHARRFEEGGITATFY
jgi:hypothetical protein